MTEREILAAEHALRLLEGEELLQARALEASEPAFAAEVRAWEARLSPLLDEIAPVELGPELWQRIERSLDRSAPNSEIIAMRRKVRRWQGAAALSAAAAVALALLAVPPLLQQPAAPTPTPVEEPAPILIASLDEENLPGSVAVTFVPAAGELLVAASAIEARAGRSHELWIIPEGGSPISLGVVATDRPAKRRVPAALVAQFRTGATVALSLEPTGGSPTGQPTGPVLATGNLQAV
ncbi:MAG TPA: anti-sigma factor [Sphingomicrobium sp.]|jgi:anti-sigma-K factor RskA|nr:anti-sigma factor [Sphingomicrobium sp.]